MLGLKALLHEKEYSKVKIKRTHNTENTIILKPLKKNRVIKTKLTFPGL